MDLHWLYKLDKFLPTPILVFDYEKEYGGYYLHPEKTEYQIGDSFFNCKNGIIVVSTAFDHNSLQNTIAHEYRHHWQFCKGWIYDGIGWNLPSEEDYDITLKNFFNSSKSEMDAYLFSVKVAYDKVMEYWLELLNG